MTTAPQTLIRLHNRLVTNLHTVNLGIVGDAQHIAEGGYHIGAKSLRAAGMWGDYSLYFAADKSVSHDYACAADIGGSQQTLMTLGNRIVNALRNRDPRVYGKVRAVNAPWAGVVIDRRYDLENPQDRTDDNVQSSSDRGHIHMEIYRSYILDDELMNGIYDVFAGVGGTAKPSQPQTKPGQKLYQGAPVPAIIRQGSNQYLGSIAGPANSHGGYHTSERDEIMMLQKRLIVCGFVPGHTNPNDGWADGVFDTLKDRPGTGATSQAVKRFQSAHMPGTTKPGQVWWDDWKKLFNL